MNKIAITAPAGKIGYQLASLLHQQQANVVLIGLERHQEKLEKFIAAGMEFRIADSDNAAELTIAFEDIDSLFWLSPPNVTEDMKIWYQNTAIAAAKAIKSSNIKHIVNLSSIGAGHGQELGTVTYIEYPELELNKLDVNIVHLRPGYFMENLLLQQQSIQNGILELPFSADHDLPWISVNDIAATACDLLLDPSWRGKWIKTIMGPENLTLTQVAAKLSTALGYQVNYRQISYQSLAQTMSEFMPKNAVDDLIKTFKALGDENGIYAMPRTRDAYTPISLEDFAREKLSVND